jgi:hypothetical protein
MSTVIATPSTALPSISVTMTSSASAVRGRSRSPT